ncbi:elongin c, putative [Eimeria necatrix]|uniref:Elongin-C n=1 Tax=Eimeria necatrix TaxID=51315 RepID=U6N6S9_9EIME|nr:elongin c, putative [Eimeria necatrix]CDJ69586.1 elongin c, putative [Eimeria necatrix]
MPAENNAESKEGKDCADDVSADAVCTSAGLGEPSSSVSDAPLSPASGKSPPRKQTPAAAAAAAAAAEDVVHLISSEGKRVDVPLNIAKECEFLERMLAGNFTESKTRELNLPNIRYNILCKAVEYLKRRYQWREEGGAPLEFEIEPEIAVDLLIAADYLGMK